MKMWGPAITFFSITFYSLAMPFYTAVPAKHYSLNGNAFCCTLNSSCDPNCTKVRYSSDGQRYGSQKNYFLECGGPKFLGRVQGRRSWGWRS